jgi:long-chain fatty acid transport protein
MLMLAKHLSVIALSLGVPTSGFALGIRLFDHDAFATARGDAFVATADNPSAIYYNPAGITQLQGHNARGAVDVMMVEADFDSPRGRDAKTQNDWVAVPGVFYSYTPQNLPFSFGIGYYLPFGFSLDWPENSQFRTTTIHGELLYQTINPIAAWKVTKTLSIAAGPTLNYASTDLRRGIAAPGHEAFLRRELP